MGILNVLTDTAHPVDQTGWAFYFRLFLLSRKAITATSKLPKDIINANIPIKIDRTSYAVIDAVIFIHMNLVVRTSCGAPPNMVKC